MNASDALNFVRRELKGLRENGQLLVNIQALDYYLVVLEDQAGRIESSNATLDAASAQMRHSSFTEMAREVHEAARNALNTAILVNGGAAVAVLGYIGSAGNTTKYLGRPLLDFGLGVLLGAVAFAARYFAGSSALLQKDTRASAFDYATILAGLTSIALFGLGIWNAYQAILIDCARLLSCARG